MAAAEIYDDVNEPHGEEEPAAEVVHDDHAGEADAELVAAAAQAAEHHEPRIAH